MIPSWAFDLQHSMAKHGICKLLGVGDRLFLLICLSNWVKWEKLEFRVRDRRMHLPDINDMAKRKWQWFRYVQTISHPAWLRDAGPCQTGVDVAQSWQTASNCKTWYQSETALFHWQPTGSRHSGVMERQECECAERRPYREPAKGIRISSPNSIKTPWTKSCKMRRTKWTNQRASQTTDKMNGSDTGAVMQARQSINLWWSYLINEKPCVPVCSHLR